MSVVVLATAFGAGKAINQPIKKQVEEMVALKGYDVFTQPDLAGILELKAGHLFVANQYGNHISTLAFMQQFVLMAKMQGWTSVRLVAAKQHIWRCARDLRHLAPEIHVSFIQSRLSMVPTLSRG